MKLFLVNVVPPASKQEMRLILWQRIVVRLGIPCIILIVGFGILLLPSYFMVSLQEEGVLRQVAISQQDPARKKAQDVSDTISGLQRKMRALNATASNGQTASANFASVLSAVPPAIAVHSFEYDAATRVISFDGFAPARADILELEKALRANANVQKVDSPLSNVIKESNISFSMNIALRP